MSTMDILMVFSVGSLLAPYVYITLTFLSLLSSFIPILKTLALHGKRRDKNYSFDDIKQGKFMTLLNHSSLLIGKRRFVDFYILGFFWSIIVLQCRIDFTTTVLYIHLLRRLYECLKIHEWNNARIHIAGYILGCLHYFLLPFIFLPDALNRRFSPTNLIYLTLNLLAQREQFLHHRILAECRRVGNKYGGRYIVPNGRLFTFISSPHYLAEIMIYFTFILFEGGHSNDEFLHASNQTLIQSVMHNQLISNETIVKNRHLFIFIWVVSNLGVSAHTNQQWYHKHFSTYPKTRYRLIPFTW